MADTSRILNRHRPGFDPTLDPNHFQLSTPDWRAEKSADIVKQICHFLVRAKANNGSSLPDPIPVSRADLAGLLWNATKLHCDANEERSLAPEGTWSPELPEFLLDHPERCEESLGNVADQDYRDPYYDRPMDSGITPDLAPEQGCALEVRHKGEAIARGNSLRGLAVRLSEAGLDPEVYLKVQTAMLEFVRLPEPAQSMTIVSEWDLWTVPNT